MSVKHRISAESPFAAKKTENRSWSWFRFLINFPDLLYPPIWRIIVPTRSILWKDPSALAWQEHSHKRREQMAKRSTGRCARLGSDMARL